MPHLWPPKLLHPGHGGEIDAQLRLTAEPPRFTEAEAARLGWSARSMHRVLKVARSIADLAGAADTGVAHVAEAIQYRRALRVGG